MCREHPFSRSSISAAGKGNPKLKSQPSFYSGDNTIRIVPFLVICIENGNSGLSRVDFEQITEVAERTAIRANNAMLKSTYRGDTPQGIDPSRGHQTVYNPVVPHATYGILYMSQCTEKQYIWQQQETKSFDLKKKQAKEEKLAKKKRKNTSSSSSSSSSNNGHGLSATYFTDKEALEAKMAADGWTKEEKKSTVAVDTNRVHKYWIDPAGGKKCRSIAEVARRAYPEFINNTNGNDDDNDQVPKKRVKKELKKKRKKNNQGGNKKQKQKTKHTRPATIIISSSSDSD